MASSLQKVLTKPPSSSIRILGLLNSTKIQPKFTEPKHDLNPFISKLPPFLLGSTNKDEISTTHFNSSVFYPSSPFGLLLDSIISTGSIQSETNDDAAIWADSVKKKRKKKMNKHKYQKLRKRLRRQT